MGVERGFAFGFRACATEKGGDLLFVFRDGVGGEDHEFLTGGNILRDHSRGGGGEGLHGFFLRGNIVGSALGRIAENFVSLLNGFKEEGIAAFIRVMLADKGAVGPSDRIVFGVR